MKINKCALAMAFSLIMGTGCCNQEQASSVSAIDVIMTRTSIRQYQDKAVEPEKVETILRAAMAAPTAVNKQPWAFVVVDDTAVRDSLVSGPQGGPVSRAPLTIVVCGDMDKALPGEALDYWIEDTSAATENLLLAAHSLGLGAVWCGVYPIQERVDNVKERLNLPHNIVPLGMVAIGYPAENPTPKDKWKPEVVRHNGFDNAYFEAK